MKRLLPFIFLLTLLASMVWATDYRVIVPTYGAGAAGPATLGSDPVLREILIELKGLRQDLAVALRNGGGAAGKTDTQPPATGIKLVATRCMPCHNADKAAGEYVMVEKDGTLADLSLERRKQNDRRVRNGSMPPAFDENKQPIPALTGPEQVDLLSVVGTKKTP